MSEGRIRVPFSMRWTGVIPEQSDFEYPISTLDLLPTIYQIAVGDLSAIDDQDGVDLLSYILKGKKDRPHQTLFWKKESRGAIREGDWKMLQYPDRPAELYNLAEDVSEVNNLVAEYPDKIKKMYKRLFEWELTLDRPLWLLKRLYEVKAMDRMDTYRKDNR